MNFWTNLFAFFLFLVPFVALPDAENSAEEFDDDAFLSGNEPKSGTGLIGWSMFQDDGEDKYIINFNNVSIIEYLRFISKIAEINFQFEESELNFTVTVISEEPLSIPNIVSSMIQALRSRGFSVLEEESTLFITRSREVNQIPTIVTDKKGKGGGNAPIITRIFWVKNANLNAVASIIRPMMSQGAMVDVSNETRQLIVTDITTNVDKVATLLKSLDVPHSNLEINLYRAKHASAEELGSIAEKIVKPFAEKTPLLFVVQNDTNSIFIVSTPHLIERSIEVMEDLDKRPTDVGGPIGSEVFLYPIENKSSSELIEALKEIGKELERGDRQSLKLIAAIENVKWIEESNSLLFVTDTPTQKKLSAILATLDASSDTERYYLYKAKQAGREEIDLSLDQLSKSLRKTRADRDLVDAIASRRYVKETNSFIFTGTAEALKKLGDLLPTLDMAIADYSPTTHFWLYTPQNLNGQELEEALDNIEDGLSSSGLTNQKLIDAIESMQWIPSTGTFLFTGDPKALTQIESIIKLVDIPIKTPSQIFIYRPQFITSTQIEEALDELADKLDHKNLADRDLASAIDNMAWISESQTFLFKADPSTIKKLQGFLQDFDNQQEADLIGSAYFLYKLAEAQGDDVIDHLDNIAKNLNEQDPEQKTLIDLIDKASYLKDTNSILLTGNPKAIEEVKLLIEQFDVKESTAPTFERSSFFIYKTQHISPDELEKRLKQTARDLKTSGLIDPDLLQSIETMRIVELTQSVLFTGTEKSLKKTQEIIETIDIMGDRKETIGEVAGQTFLIYKVRHTPIDQLLKSLRKVAENLAIGEISPENQQMSKTIRGAKEIKETHSILFTGPPEVLEKIAQLVRQFDQPTDGSSSQDTSQEIEGFGEANYLIYKPVNVSGPELIDMMSDFEANLQSSGISLPGLYDTIANLKYIELTGYILVSGDKKSIEKVQELLRKFDILGPGGVTSLNQMETSFLIYKLHYHPGNDIKDALKQIGEDLSNVDTTTGKNLLNAINSIQWIKMTNSLLATGTPDVLTQLKELVQNIDTPLRQVFIEVLIIRTTIVNNQQFGLQWGGKVQYLNRFAGGVSNFPTPSPEGGASTSLAKPLAEVNAIRTPLATDILNPSTTGGGFDLGVIGDIILHKGRTFFSLASLVTALQADEDTVIVMNPKIVAQDNQQATIFVGQNIPFTGSSVETVQGGGTQVQANIEYRDVGTNLTITPILGTNDIVTLDISNEISAQVNTSTTKAPLQGLQTTRTSLNARVHIPNKHFVALSGMISDTKSRFRSAIPCLGGLPVIGAIFSANDRLNSRDNLIFFIRPVIIDSIEEYDQITQNQESLFKELGVKQVIKEEIDAGIDWVKESEYYCD